MKNEWTNELTNERTSEQEQRQQQTKMWALRIMLIKININRVIWMNNSNWYNCVSSAQKINSSPSSSPAHLLVQIQNQVQAKPKHIDWDRERVAARVRETLAILNEFHIVIGFIWTFHLAIRRVFICLYMYRCVWVRLFEEDAS